MEIGPGAGVMTALLAHRVKRVVAVEIDKRLEPILNAVLFDFDNTSILFSDILKTNLQQLAQSGLDLTHYHLVANLPYYITTDILQRFLTCEMPPKRICIMVQEEAAQRITSIPGSKSWCALAAFTAWYGKARIVQRIPASAFQPMPHVDSAFVDIQPVERPQLTVEQRRLLNKTIKTAFAMRRKKLTNNLRSAFSFTQEEALAILHVLQFDENLRGETLTAEDLYALSCQIETSLANKRRFNVEN